ncbi:LuxR C-terminal-related transcriptional regulator [Microbacterium deminutum]|uniref:LuxR C-terminal-related transcriptional regulator n=1 Tax=Microbacterium deminutum TaxID=344164 RepID=UPI0031E297AD
MKDPPRLSADPPSAETSLSPTLGPRFRPPAARAGIVTRTALIERLTASDSPVIALVAPPGYGKTTLLAQWVRRLGPRVAWVSCEKTDDDPAALWTAVATAIDAVAPLGPAASRLLAASGGSIGIVPAFVAAIEPIGPPMTIVLDHLEHVSSAESHAALAEFAMRVPPDWQLALASREPLPVPTARLRSQGRILELGSSELAMSEAEAQALMAGAGVDAQAALSGRLLQQTEGWPVGLYLAARAMKEGTPIGDFAFGGDDRWVGEYLRSELLSRVTADEARLLLRASVLDRLSGPLCDAIADVSGSSRVLEDLVGRNMLVVPLDRHREWYRYHHLLREHLQAELRVLSPDDIPELHSRAAAWYVANGMPEEAVEHAQAAADADLVAVLILELMSPVWASGRVETVLRWMQWLEGHPSASHYSAVMAHGSLIHALLGRAAESERWAEVAERLPSEAGQLPDGSSVAGTLDYMRANLARDGVPGMRREARAAWDGLGPASPYRATLAHIEGVSYLLERDLDRADAVMAHASDLAAAQGNMPFVSLILAERCVVATERNDWPVADSFSQRALRMVEDGGLDGYWTSALVFATAARSAAHGGDMPAARRLSRRAAQLRPLLTYALPVVAVQTLVELARAYLGFADQDGAAAALDQATRILHERPDLGTLPRTVASLQARVGEIRETTIGASSLTAAELRLVPLLPTHLSMREIGERLHISRNTVKSELISLYRKLGVSSRSEAVTRTSDLGLRI